MSLNWDISNCKNIPADWREPNPDYDPTDEDSDAQPDQWTDDAWHIINRAIWATIMTNHGWELTEANAATFYSRHYLWARMHGEEPFTMEQVVALIGLRTNVGPMADQTWRTKYIKHYETEKRKAFLYKSGIDSSKDKPVKASR